MDTVAASIVTMTAALGEAPPYSIDQVRRYLTSLYINKAGSTTGDKIRRALNWWHEVANCPTPCNESITRLCDAMHRELPTRGAVARRPLTREEGLQVISLSESLADRKGDNWHRNTCILALDITTGLRINDILQLRHSDLKWSHGPLRLSLWLVDGKKDRFSEGAWSIEYIAALHSYTDGITRLWEFTQSFTGPPSEYLFKSSATNSYVTYDSMLAVLHKLATQLNLPNPQQIGWHSCRKTRADEENAGTEGDIAAVRHVLGHSANSRSTPRYLSSASSAHPPTAKRK